MMTSLLITMASMALACLVMVSLFRKNNRELRIGFSEKMSQWEENLKVHQQQIKIRTKGLDRYDFQKYNLGESLVVQSEIKIQ